MSITRKCKNHTLQTNLWYCAYCKRHRTLTALKRQRIQLSFTIVSRPGRGDNPRALASGLSHVQVDKPWHEYLIPPTSLRTLHLLIEMVKVVKSNQLSLFPQRVIEKKIEGTPVHCVTKRNKHKTPTHNERKNKQRISNNGTTALEWTAARATAGA